MASFSITTSVAVFLSAAILVLLCGSVHQATAARCTCPPHYFDAYRNTSNPQLVANGAQAQLFMMGNARSGFLPRDPTTLDVESFRVALYLISAMYEIAVSTDQPVIEGGVNNDILRDILNGLAADACNWINETTSNSGITCDIPSLVQLHRRLSSYENSHTARDAAHSAIAPTGASGPSSISKDRCAWINHRIFDDCTPTCTSVGATAQDTTVMYYDAKFGCSQLRDSASDPAGDYALCSNAQ